MAEKFDHLSPYNYALNSPIAVIDPTGMMAEWIPGMDANGNITLTAERGDNLKSLMDFFKNDKATLKQFVKDKDLKKDRKFKEGETITLKEDNVLSQSLRYAQGDADFEDNRNYDCQAFVASTMMKGEAKLDKNAYPNSDNSESLQEYGTLKYSAKEISDSQQIPGKTYTFWNMNGIFPVIHTAVHFGYDKNGTEYFVTKNGSNDRPLVQTRKQLPYLLMWDRINYKFK